MTQHYAMLQRNLLYTGVTRGKKLVVIAGQKKAVAIAVRNRVRATAMVEAAGVAPSPCIVDSGCNGTTVMGLRSGADRRYSGQAKRVANYLAANAADRATSGV